jgi:hypothetical protein
LALKKGKKNVDSEEKKDPNKIEFPTYLPRKTIHHSKPLPKEEPKKRSPERSNNTKY